MKHILSICLFLSLNYWCSASNNRDTLKVLHYNLLNYGNYFGGCTEFNNNVADKDDYLRTIIDASQPDIFTVNEMGANNVFARRIVENCLNQNGRDYYKQASFSNNSRSSIVNMLFYNSNKVELLSQDFIDRAENNVELTRRIDIYTLYFKDPFLDIHKDTLKFRVFVCHLSAADATKRRAETAAIGEYLRDKKLKDNYFLCGDLNIDSSSSISYQNLINNSVTEHSFHDPINRPGSWSNDSSFSKIHTQSTHTSPGCASSGGMDDRFDFILISNDIKDDSSGIYYLNNSYKAVGQDGLRFNRSLISPTNTTYSNSVIQALYEMSDHLPVKLNLAFRIKELSSSNTDVKAWTHKIYPGELRILNPSASNAFLNIRDLSGRLIYSESFNHEKESRFSFKSLDSGIYLMHFGIEGAEAKQLKVALTK